MLYHLSTDENLKVLTPKIPKNALPEHEDVKTKRICFSDSIEGCLSSLQTSPNKYYVYVPENEVDEIDIYIPTVDEVIDAKFTHEVWIMKEIKVKCIGAIQAKKYDFKKRYSSGRGRITFFHYPYEWIEKKNIKDKF